MRTEADFGLATEQLLEDELDGPLQISHRHAAIHVKALDLLEGGIMGGVGIVPAVNAAGDNDAHRRRLLFHDADLH